MTTQQCTRHRLDDVLDFRADGDHAVTGWTVPEYHNVFGPFGGATAAFVLHAIDAQADRIGRPLALTVTYAAPIGTGRYQVTLNPVRTNRSTQHWTAQVVQNGDVKSTATAVFGIRRETFADTEAVMPWAPNPERCPEPVWPTETAFLRNYDIRVVAGGPGDRPVASSQSVFWIRHAPARRLDFPALAAVADVFFPRVFLRLGGPVPASTISMTTYFHAGIEELDDVGDDYLLGVARAQCFDSGFFDQQAQLWSRAGVLLATSNQLVYYRDPTATGRSR